MFSTRTSGKGAGGQAPASGGKGAMPSIISQRLSVRGDLTCEGDIQIEGVVEGDVRTETLTIGASGSVKGAISAETVHVAGTVVGQIRAKIVSLTRSARVEGDIWHESLSIEAGAQFEGSCKRLGGTSETTLAPRTNGVGSAARESAPAVILDRASSEHASSA